MQRLKLKQILNLYTKVPNAVVKLQAATVRRDSIVRRDCYSQSDNSNSMLQPITMALDRRASLQYSGLNATVRNNGDV